MAQQNISDALNKVYLRQKLETQRFNNFCEQLETLRSNVEKSANAKESEEHVKGFVKDFLNESFYKKTNLVNTKDNIDWAIFETLENTSTIQVIIEAKRPGNNEFPTLKNLNSKAMQETVLYYMRERIKAKNIDLKHIIITNGFEWFVFDAAEYETHFMGNKDLVKHYKDFEVTPTLFSENTSMFYNEIAKPVIDAVKDNINYVYFDLRLMTTDKQKVQIFKILSPEHLLRKFVCNDSNELNAPFYNELLYILGLEEVADGSKKKICRLKPADRQSASFIENAIDKLEIAEPNPDRQFEKALSLTITWINRILFLKLLESQLVNYHKGDRNYCFLNTEKIKGFDDLQQLFFKVLAVPVKERKPVDVAEKYKLIPYLNSSLFELTDDERDCQISGLRDDNLPIHKQTILRDSRNSKRLTGELPVIEYLFRFLDAYDFGSEPNDDSLTRDNRKTLINASVLGLIFEKINGYKDGSFFTPGFITQYMCRESLRRAVVQKFNEAKTWNCQTFGELVDKDLDRTEANQIINSLRICDPAVGSGHFLVSALNELIAIKADLRVLQRTDGRRLKNKIAVENDELMVYDEDDDDEPFVYTPKNGESQMVQQSLFEEKRVIIENCLFGVDINPNSVNICRLRLWIELLKNAYYKEDGEFETLPNIDINIKCGNSLVSYYPLQLGKAVSADDSLKGEIKKYKACVKAYKYESNKVEKQKVKESIAKLKHKIAPGVQLSLELESKDIEANRKALESNIYRNSMEWMIEFPEVLDEDGNFMGFDVVIGNPPYIDAKKLKHIAFALKKYEVSSGTADISIYFTELALKLAKAGGRMFFITTNKFYNTGYGKKLRNYILNRNIEYLIDFEQCEVFKEALVSSVILGIENQKAAINNKFIFHKFYKLDNETLVRNFTTQQNDFEIFVQSNLDENEWSFATDDKSALKSKLATFTIVKDLKGVSVYRGVTTGFNPAFIISNQQRDQLISDDPNNAAIIKNLLQGRNIRKWYYNESDENLLQTGFDINVENNYPFVYQHLLLFQKELKVRADQGKKWYNLRACKYYNEFEKPEKIIWGLTADKWAFTLDTEQHYLPSNGYIMTSENIPIRYLLGILNAKVLQHYFGYIGVMTAGGAYTLKATTIEALPIPSATPAQQQQIIDLVNYILDAKKQDPQANTTEQEHEIDLLVYHLYGLSFDEVKMIDETVTEEEFLDVE